MEASIKNNIKNIIKGAGIAIIFSLICLLIFSAVLTYTNISEEWIQPVIIVLTGISILIGSSLGSLKLKKNGIMTGAIIGGTYFLALYIISSLLSMNFSINTQMLITIGVGMAFGILGGIIGVNKK